MTFLDIFRAGGITMYILILCSAGSIAIIIERLWYYAKRSRISREEFMMNIDKELDKGNTTKALELCNNANTPFARVVYAGLSLVTHPETVIDNAMQREIMIESVKLERYTGIVGTIGGTAVYIGLFGTVLGIMRAFHDISQNGSGGINIVINGIAEALVCTAAGLAVAVPAVMAYNYFLNAIDNFTKDMELSASETLDLINVYKRK